MPSILDGTMEWPAFYPDDCPYSHSTVVSGVVYRLVTPTLKGTDFQSHRERFPDKVFQVPECEACGLSVVLDREEIISMQRTIPLFKKKVIAWAELSGEHGRIAPTPKPFAESHCTWWVPLEVDASQLFAVEPVQG